MHIRVSASSALRGTLSGAATRPRLLGAGPRAVYLDVSGEVVAVLAADAVRLPCAIVLPSTSTELPLTELGEVQRVGAGTVVTSAAELEPARWWAPARVGPAGRPAPLTLPDTGVDEALVSALTGTAVAAAAALLGRGPGLTPAGDDLLAGFLLGARAFGVPAGPVRDFVATHATAGTTALSARLLHHALAGECVPQASTALATGDLTPLLAVGHTSGAALARGLLRAAELAPARAAA